MTTAKEVQVSGDGGSTFETLPGGTGAWNDEGEQITDTIFGATYESSQPGLIAWTSEANALYKGFAGYVAVLKKSGTSTQMTDEPMNLVTGTTKTYEITDAVRQVLDWTQPIVVNDNASPVAANDIESIDNMFGRVKFASGYTPTTPVTMDAWYLPLTNIAKAQSFTLTQTAATLDKSAFDVAQANNGYRVFDPGLRTVGLDLGGFYDSASQFWTDLENRASFVLEINPDGSGLSTARGIFKLITRGQSGDVGALEEETRTFGLAVPSDVDFPFNWRNDPNTTMHPSIQILLDSFLNQTNPTIRYLPEGEGVLGFQGVAVVTDVSLSSGLDAMNEFAASFQGSDAPTRQVYP